MEKINKIVELKIDDEDLFIDKLGLEIVSFVEQPAIEVNWKSFSKEMFVERSEGESKDEFIERCMSKLVGDENMERDQAFSICMKEAEKFEFETYNDYPEAARNAACRAVEWAEKNGWGDCGTDVGKQRAHQLCKGENISRDTIARMAGFKRHQQNKDVPYSEGCGGIMWDSWGGDAGINWAQRKLDEIDKQKLNSSDTEMVEGIIDLLKKVKDPQNRQDIAVSIIKDFIEESVDFNLDDFLERIEVELQIDTTNLKPYRDQTKKKIISKPVKLSTFRDVELEDIKYGDYVFSVENQLEVLKYADSVGIPIEENDVILELKKEGFSFIKDILKGLMVIDSLTTNQAASDEGEIFYRYAGPSPERNFCRAMLRLNKVYTFDDIQQMEQRGINIEFGHERQPYSIWEYKGGPYCKHYWSKLEIFRGTNNQKVIIDHGRVEGLPGTEPNVMFAGGHHPDWIRQHMMSMNPEKRIVMGPLLIPHKMIERVDDDGNKYYVYFTKETIRKISQKALKDSVHNNTDINHDEKITNKNTLLESWIVEDSKYDKSYKYGFNLPVGTWVVSYKVGDDKTWDKIKSGELKGFSAAGYFLERDKKQKQSSTELQKIITILNETTI